jgi:16S rRNA processing protein RimM
MSDDSSALIQVGVVGAPFGVRGWVKLRSHTDPPERLLKHRNLYVGRGAGQVQRRIEATGRSGGALTVKFVGVEDRDQAAALRGAPVSVERAALPPKGDKDFYRADLIGCEVFDLSGVSLGVVQHFVETPANVLMVVRGTREHWIPAVPKHLQHVDLAARRVTVEWEQETE